MHNLKSLSSCQITLELSQALCRLSAFVIEYPQVTKGLSIENLLEMQTLSLLSTKNWHSLFDESSTINLSRLTVQHTLEVLMLNSKVPFYFNSETILQMYRLWTQRFNCLFRQTPLHYRTNNKGVVLKSASPSFIEKYLKQLCYEVQTALEVNKEQIHPLIIIIYFKFQWMRISPFEEFNDKFSNLLILKMLSVLGYHYLSLSSIESLYAIDADAYVEALNQAFIEDEKISRESVLPQNYCYFIQKFAKTFEQVKTQLDKAKVNTHLSHLSQNIMTHVQTQGRSSIRELLILTGANRNTLKKHLAMLVEKQQIKQHGKGPATWYTLN